MTVRPHGFTRYKHGPDANGTPGIPCRCAVCRVANNAWQRHRARQIGYGRWAPTLDATGTRRRLGGLMWQGWSMGQLGTRLGRDRKEVHRILAARQVTPRTAEKVRVLCRALLGQVPPEGTRHEKMAVTKARAYARAHGFVPLAAWDAIDDPDATPVPGWERGGKREWGTLAAEALELINGFGLDRAEAAERLGVSPSTLGTTLARARSREQDAATGEAA